MIQTGYNFETINTEIDFLETKSTAHDFLGLYEIIYSKMAAQLPLRPGHRSKLLERGITEEQIQQCGFFSSPITFDFIRGLEREFTHEDLLKIPGFYLNPTTSSIDFVGRDGIIIPHRSSAGNIVSLQIRHDTEAHDKRYRWISSSRHGGSKALLTPFLAGFDEENHAFITEGALKALIIEKKWGKATIIAVPGVNNWATALPILARKNIKSVTIAFDRDMIENKDVAKYTYQLCNHLNNEGLEVSLATWDSAKGIDDALQAGQKINIIKGTELEKFLIALSEKFNPKDGTWEKGNGEFSCWPSLPEAVETDLPTIPKEAVPANLASFAEDVAERMQVPWEMVLAPLVVVLSSLIAGKIKIKPKRLDPWTVVVNLWGFIAAAASSLKSPTMNAVIGPLRKIEAEFAEEYRQSMQKWQADKKAIEAAIKQCEKNIEKLLEKNPNADLTIQKEILLKYQVQLEEGKPKQKRLTYNDATTEKIGELLIENPLGLLGLFDELIGLLKVFEKPGREGDRSFNLEAWSGDTSKSIDRIGRGSLFIPVLRLSIFGAIPPQVLIAYLTQLGEDLMLEDGFMQRLQIFFMTKMTKSWKNVDRYPNKMAEDGIFDLYRKIISLPNADDENKAILSFDEDAQNLFNDWLEVLELRLRSGDIQPQALVSHLGKYRSLLPSLALIFCVCDELREGSSIGTESKVKLTHLDMAITWCRVLESHAATLYKQSDEASSRASSLVEKIMAGKVPHQVTIRILAGKGWKDLNTSEKIRAAAAELQSLGYLRVVEQSKGRGHPSTKIFLHPSLRKDLGHEIPK